MIPTLMLALAPLQDRQPRTYRAWLETPGGDLGFGLELQPKGDDGWSAFLTNGEERIEVPRVTFDGKDLLLDMPHYDSRITAEVVPGIVREVPQPDGTTKQMQIWSAGDCLGGFWSKRRGPDATALVPFVAAQPAQGTPVEHHGWVASSAVAGRWSVAFEGEAQPAVAVFGPAPKAADWNGVRGTFLTATGDYRYLAGRLLESGLTLSCFDGAHAFLFTAKQQPDGTLSGDFWSGNWHHETWMARRDESAALEDAFAQTSWNGQTKLADLVFPDLDSLKHSLGEFAGKATLLVVLGSWCPNCNDEAKLLADLDAKYRARGLRILGLAFELTGEFARDAEQVRIFARRHALEIPFFLCGTADKDEATKALGLVDRVRSFPTTVFVGADGLPKAIHSGFAGPATGEEHVRLRRDFEARIEALLGGR